MAYPTMPSTASAARAISRSTRAWSAFAFRPAGTDDVEGAAVAGAVWPVVARPSAPDSTIAPHTIANGDSRVGLARARA